MKSTLHAALLGAALLLLAATSARAQSPVFTVPQPALTNNLSGTIAVTSTFQQVFPQANGPVGSGNPLRRGCAIQNTGTHVMFVYFGNIANATTSNSYPLAAASLAGQPGGWISCESGGVVATDAVNITGTAGDTFVATGQ